MESQKKKSSQQCALSSPPSYTETTILDLPQEIRNEILSYLLPRDTSHISQSCRALYNAHSPSLYTTITLLSPLKYAAEEECIISLPSPHAHLLARTITSQFHHYHQKEEEETAKGKLISSLTLHRFSARHDNSLKFLLPHTSNLSKLHIDFLLSQHFTFGHEVFNPSTLPRLLHAVRTTLSHLKITYTVSTSAQNLVPRIVGPCCLREMEKLKVLEIPWCVLFGNEMRHHSGENTGSGEDEGEERLMRRQIPKLSTLLPPCLTHLAFTPSVSLYSQTRFYFSIGEKEGFMPQELGLAWSSRSVYGILEEFLAGKEDHQQIYPPAQAQTHEYVDACKHAHAKPTTSTPPSVKPKLHSLTANMLDMRDSSQWTLLTNQTFSALEAEEHKFEEMISRRGVKCSEFKLHPSMVLDLDLGV